MKNVKKMIIFVFICIILFLCFNYIFFNSGNNINSRSDEQIVDKMLKKINNYEAEIEIIVNSNKNENRYVVFQSVENNHYKEEIISPENLKNMIIEFEGNTLVISNTNLNMKKIYDDYEYIVKNVLFLDTFIQDYNNNTNKKIYYENDLLVIALKELNSQNTYITYRYLYLNKETELPEKLIIKDITQRTYISILYKDIKIK